MLIGNSLDSFTENYGNDGINKSCYNCRSNNGSGINTAVLLSVGDHADRDQLKGGNIDD